MTHTELLEVLRREREDVLIELLDLNSDEIVDAFLDKIEDRLEYLHGQYQEEDKAIT